MEGSLDQSGRVWSVDRAGVVLHRELLETVCPGGRQAARQKLLARLRPASSEQTEREREGAR